MKKGKILAIILTITIAITPTIAFAHGGRTDSQGGHHDYKNASGLGSYHYHHGYSAHLHPNGVCPYGYTGSGSASSTSTVVPTVPTINLQKPTFGVFVNGYNLNNTSSQYYPSLINGVVYIPLTTEMITALKLKGGWDAANGLVLASAADISPSSTFQAASAQIAKTKSISKPSFPVVVNGANLNVTDSQYYPVNINDVTYVPLSSEVIEALHLSGGWTGTNGMVLSSK